MVAWLSNVLIVGSLVTALWGLVEGIRGVRPSGPLLLAVAVLWVGLLAQAVIGAYFQFSVDNPPDGWLFLGYHLTAVTVLPAGAAWAIGDRSRWGNGVLAIACATEAVLVIRLVQIWVTRG